MQRNTLASGCRLRYPQRTTYKERDMIGMRDISCIRPPCTLESKRSVSHNAEKRC